MLCYVLCHRHPPCKPFKHFLSLIINISKVDVQFAACQQVGVKHFAVIFQIAKMPLTPYPDWFLFFLRLIISGDKVIITDQFIFQLRAFACNILFHKNRLLNVLYCTMKICTKKNSI